MTEEIKKLIESVKVYQHPVPLCFDSIARALVDKSDFDKVVKELEYLSELRKPSEDIKQAIEEAAAKYAGISDDKFANSAKTYDAYNIDESFKNGAEFTLQLFENSIQLDEDLVKEIVRIIQSDCGVATCSACGTEQYAALDYDSAEETAIEIAKLIPSSRSQENGAELLEAAKQILDLHVCEMEGLSSGQPTPTEWMNAVDKLSEAISNYEKQSK